LYAYLAREGEATVQDVMDDVALAQGTAYSYVNRLVDAGVVEMTHRLMAEDLDISALVAELILQALRPVVHEHCHIEEAGAGLGELDIDDTDDA
jgi:DNA-binding IclR family transcriptional regulator